MNKNVKVILEPKRIDRFKNMVVVDTEGDWNDGDEISGSTLFTLDDYKNFGHIAVAVFSGDDEEFDTSDLPPEVKGAIYKLTPSGCPDGSEYHTVWVNDITYYDENGNPFDIKIEEEK